MKDMNRLFAVASLVCFASTSVFAQDQTDGEAAAAVENDHPAAWLGVGGGPIGAVPTTAGIAPYPLGMTIISGTPATPTNPTVIQPTSAAQLAPLGYTIISGAVPPASPATVPGAGYISTWYGSPTQPAQTVPMIANQGGGVAYPQYIAQPQYVFVPVAVQPTVAQTQTTPVATQVPLASKSVICLVPAEGVQEQIAVVAQNPQACAAIKGTVEDSPSAG